MGPDARVRPFFMGSGRGIPLATQTRVMPGLVPGIHVFSRFAEQDVDGLDKPGHDEEAWE